MEVRDVMTDMPEERSDGRIVDGMWLVDRLSG